MRGIGVVRALAAAGAILGAPTVRASGRALPEGIFFESESNNTDVNNLSAAGPAPNGGQMPVVYLTLTATVWQSYWGYEGRTVQFTTNHPEWLALDRASDITNYEGQCRVVVHGTGACTVDNSLVTVTATWTNALGKKYPHTCNLHLLTHNTTYLETPEWHPPLYPVPIPYYEINLSMMMSAASQSRTDYSSHAFSHIAYTSSALNPKITFQECWGCEDNTAFAWTIYEPTTGVSEIHYNMSLLHGDRDPDFWYVTTTPLGWRHHVRHTADHEMAHALLLGHNGVFQKSLVWGGTYPYFVWLTEIPREDSEWTPLNAAYWY
jgi:hypothetical protein